MFRAVVENLSKLYRYIYVTIDTHVRVVLIRALGKHSYRAPGKIRTFLYCFPNSVFGSISLLVLCIAGGTRPSTELLFPIGRLHEIGRASCRERVEISVVAVSL